MEKLRFGLQSLGLDVFRYSDDLFAVKIPGIANPLLYFNPKDRGAAYDGSVSVKAFNVGVFSAIQIREALSLVSEYLIGEESK